MSVNCAERMLVVWCADWPVVATGRPPTEPVVVMRDNIVLSASLSARLDEVRPGLRRREAQARCPDLTIFEYEPGRDVQSFEPVAVAIETVAPRIEVMDPGTLAVPTKGPSRYFGGEEALVHHFKMLTEEALSNSGLTAAVGVGIADGTFAATLAARASLVVPVGASAAFLSPQPVNLLERPELVDLLQRLGIRTLGDFAALPASDVLGRFGNEGAVVHRMSRGLDPEPFRSRVSPPELAVVAELDPPVQRLDMAAFAARSIAERLHISLSERGLACSRLLIEVETEHGESMQRLWRHDGRLSTRAIAERLRWQLEGWLGGHGIQRGEDGQPTSGLTSLRLTPEGLVPDNGRQLGFWGGAVDADERTERALARVQGLLGEEAVVTAVIGGGRSPLAQVRMVPWGVAREAARPGYPSGWTVPVAPSGRSGRRSSRPLEVPSWPGALPKPAPATVYEVRPTADVVGSDDLSIGVDGRGVLSAPPVRVSMDGGPWFLVQAWAGPWLVDECWWDSSSRRRFARLQILVESGDALLAVLEDRRWSIEALYD